MAQMTDVYDNDALIKWNTTNHSMEGEAAIGCGAADDELEMTVEDSRTVDTAANDQAYMYISDTSGLPTLAAGIFSSDEAAVSVEQPQNGSSLLPVLSDMNVERFDGTTEPGNLSRVEQDGLACDTVELSLGRPVSSSAKSSDNPHPLGSSQNPIRIIQQGNKYTSMQELSPEQLNQIMQVHRSTLGYYYFHLFWCYYFITAPAVAADTL